MILRIAALGEGVVGVTLEKEIHCLLQDCPWSRTQSSISMSVRTRKETSFGATTVTSVRILALIAICVSVSVTSYLSGCKEDVHSCVSALRLGMECSKGEISQWRPVGH